jgi:2-oxoglutarate ferredoxin oxidoreductase subunit alpha
MERLRRKIDGARNVLPEPIIREEKEKAVGIIFYGSMENTIVEIDDILEKTGLKVSTCRVRALPYHSQIESFIEEHEKTIILEINRDGQLFGILRKELPNHLVTKIKSVAYSDGLPPRARVYSDLILDTLKEA